MGGEKAPLLKIGQTYSVMIKLGTIIPYLKKMQKMYDHVTHLLISADISMFPPEVSYFDISRNTDLD